MIEKTISNFVEQQFPQFYRDDYPIFIAFVREYFKWMQTEYPIAELTYAQADQNPKIDITAQSTQIVSRDSRARFTNTFSNGDVIAVFNSNNDTDYRIYTIDYVVNNSTAYITSDSIPLASVSNTRYSETKSQKNPLQYSRAFYDNMDVDTTADEFLVHFKEKYLKNIQFSTNANTRQLIKHALDIYRSKGTERAADLLFKIVFGVGATVYYPATDVFRLSDGHWYRPRYLEVSLKESNVKLINKQVQGLQSGATAFVEAVVRKTVKGRLIDVLYISAINGSFQTGEIINTADNILLSNEQPTIIGSLTTINIPMAVGTGYRIGDIVGIESVSGEGAKGRVSGLTDTYGLVNIELINGGYAYSNTAEVLISEHTFGVTNLVVPPTFSGDDYFVLFEDVQQVVSAITYDSANGSFLSGDEIFSYDGNNAVIGHGRVISTGANTLLASVFSGNISGNFYTTGNAVTANAITVVDDSSYANVFARSANVGINLVNITGAFEVGEEVYQIHPVSEVKVANGTLTNFVAGVGSNGSISTANSQGMFRSEWPIIGATSGAIANSVDMTITIGVKDIRNEFITTPNNYFYFSNSGISGSLYFISSGNNASAEISPSLNYTETVDVNTDFFADYRYLPFEHVQLTGAVAVNSTSTDVIGTGTDFTTELRHSVSGSVSISNNSTVIVGTSTNFTTEIACNDIIVVDGEYRRVREIANDTYLWINAAFTTTNTAASANVANYIIVDDGANYEARRIVDVTNTTHLVVDTAFSFDSATANVTTSWGFGAMPEANSTNANIADILSTTSLEIGKVFSLAGINMGTDYNYAPFIRIYEKYTYPESKRDVILNVTGASSIFSPGEVVTQENNNARGIVKVGNTSVIYVEQLRFEDANNFTVTSNAETVLVGENTGSMANIVSVFVDTESEILGFNANVATSVAVGNGAITSVEVVDSGFGFRENEEITMSFEDEILFARAGLGTQGAGTGFYKKKGGFLSDQKKLFDGLYYQDFSYEIRSSVTLNRYEAMLKQLLHVAGTKYFGAFVFNTEADCEISSRQTRISSE